MTRKFAMKSILALSLGFMLSVISTIASAVLSPQSTTSTTCTLLLRSQGKCSLEVLGFLRGLGNTTNNDTAYRVRIGIQAGFIVFTNPAGNTSTAQGVPFANILVELGDSGLISEAQIDARGRTLESIVFHEDDLIRAIKAGLRAGCEGGNLANCDSETQIQSQVDQHPNWIPWAVITSLQVLGQQVRQSTSPDCSISGGVFTGCDVVDALGQNPCLAPNTVVANPQKFVGKQFNYQCTEVCHDQGGGPDCPPGLPLPSLP